MEVCRRAPYRCVVALNSATRRGFSGPRNPSACPSRTCSGSSATPAISSSVLALGGAALSAGMLSAVGSMATSEIGFVKASPSASKASPPGPDAIAQDPARQPAAAPALSPAGSDRRPNAGRPTGALGASSCPLPGACRLTSPQLPPLTKASPRPSPQGALSCWRGGLARAGGNGPGCKRRRPTTARAHLHGQLS